MNDLNQPKMEISKLTRISFICASIGIILVWGIFLGSVLLLNILENVLSSEVLEFLNSQTFEAVMFYVLLVGLVFSVLGLFSGIASIIFHLFKRKGGKFFGRGKLIKSFLMSALSLFALFGIFVISPNPPHPSLSKEQIKPRVESAMAQIRAKAEIIKDREGGYALLSCDYDQEMWNLCDDIEEHIGSKPTIHSNKEAYCAYIQLDSREYYCVDSTLGVKRTTINPAGVNYCDGITFTCPR